MYTTRVHGRQILLEKPVRESRAKKELEAKRALKKKERERKKLGIIGKKEARQQDIWKFDKKQAKCALFLIFDSLTHPLDSTCSFRFMRYGWGTCPNSVCAAFSLCP
jgi:hypothetical protein